MSLLSQLFTPPRPVVAVDITSTRVAAIRLGGGRPAPIVAHASELLPPGVVVPALAAPNIVEPAPVAAAVTRALDAVGRSRHVALVLPDSAAKVSLVRFEQSPPRGRDLEAMLRWQVRKSVPFRVEDAQITWAEGQTLEGGGREFLVALSRRDVIAQVRGGVDRGRRACRPGRSGELQSGELAACRRRRAARCAARASGTRLRDVDHRARGASDLLSPPRERRWRESGRSRPTRPRCTTKTGCRAAASAASFLPARHRGPPELRARTGRDMRSRIGCACVSRRRRSAIWRPSAIGRLDRRSCWTIWPRWSASWQGIPPHDAAHESIHAAVLQRAGGSGGPRSRRYRHRGDHDFQHDPVVVPERARSPPGGRGAGGGGPDRRAPSCRGAGPFERRCGAHRRNCCRGAGGQSRDRSACVLVDRAVQRARDRAAARRAYRRRHPSRRQGGPVDCRHRRRVAQRRGDRAGSSTGSRRAARFTTCCRSRSARRPST